MAKRKSDKEASSTPEDCVQAQDEGLISDHVTGNLVKESEKEKVLQHVARAMTIEYLIMPDDMERDFRVKLGSGKSRKIDIAIFVPDKPHVIENLTRAILCRPEPKSGKKAVSKIRDYDQAREDLSEIEEILRAVKTCEWGLWTNGLEQFFLHKKARRFEDLIEQRGDWPKSDGTSTPDVETESYLRRGSEEAIKRAFRRCHNFIHGNEGMPKDAAFWQFLYLIFAKMCDERRRDGHRQFFAAPDEVFEEAGRMGIRKRIEDLFKKTKAEPPFDRFFKSTDTITLSDRALSYMVNELQRYDFSRTEVDVKGAAYQEIVGNNLRGDRGQYFTPRRAVDLAVRILDPRPDEKVFDPACGTGGFLVATIAHQFRRFKKESRGEPGDRTLDSIHDRLRDYAHNQVFGADFDPFLVRASNMNVMMAANADGHIYHMDSLAFPAGHLAGNAQARESVKFGSVDVLLTNPPFGSDIPITEPTILRNNPLAKRYRKSEAGEWVESAEYQTAVAPEVLFISQAVKWLRPGGRMGIVLPNGILGNPGDEPIRRWILQHCWILGCVEIPVEAFIVEANVGILTSVLFLKKKTDDEMAAEAMGHTADYPIFMAVAERAGVDRRGNPLYKRNPDGTELIIRSVEKYKIKTNGSWIERSRTISGPILDDDFPAIVEAYSKFRHDNPEPGIE
jgi:type I restriction enzyme M protein